MTAEPTTAERYVRLHPRYRAEVLSAEALMLRDGEEYVVIESPVVARIGQRLAQGACAVAALIEAIERELPDAAVAATLAQLEADGLLVEHDASWTPAEEALAAHLDVAPRVAADAVRSRRFHLTTLGPDPAPFAALLHDLGLQPAQAPDAAAVHVVLTDDYLDPRLDAINREAVAHGQGWMPLKPAGVMPYLGPLFIPGETACWACLARRLRMNRRAEAFLEHQGTQAGAASVPALASLAAVALHRAAWALANWIVCGEDRVLDGHLVTLDAPAWTPTAHVVQRLVTCAVCGTAPPAPDEATEARPFVLTARPKVHTTDGGHRTQSPAASFAAHAHFIDPLTGVLRNLTRLELPEAVGPGTSPIHAFRLEHSLVSVFNTLNKLRRNESMGSAGKGKTEAQARASALFEGLERFSAVWQGDEPRRPARYVDLAPDAFHLHDLLGFSPRQYAERAHWNATCASETIDIPEPFDEQAEIDWVPVWSLTHQRTRYVPAAYGYFGYPDRHEPFCFGDSNGNAAGVSPEGALLQGFYEAVERDAISLWWYNRLRRPAVDLDAFDDPYGPTLRAYYREALGRDLWVLDLTSDLDIPCFVALSGHTARLPEDLIMGFGCHLDPHVALSRALTEVNQLLHLVSYGGPDDYATRDPLLIEWMKTARLADHPYLAPDPAVPARTPEAFGYRPADDLLDDVQTCLAKAHAVGLEVCVLDLTRADIGLPVVKVVVPGLMHYWRRLGHRRLYEVPVRMGWLSEPRREEDMNPFSIVI